MSEALAGMAGNDLVKQMAECLQVVHDSPELSERVHALETLQEICEDLDLAAGRCIGSVVKWCTVGVV